MIHGFDVEDFVIYLCII